MVEAGEVVVRFKGDTSQLHTSTNRASRALQGFQRIAATVGVGLLAREFNQAAESVANLTARISLYTSTNQEARAAVSELFDTARRTGVAFDALAETYARLAPAQQALGFSGQQLADVSEAVAASFRISGATAQEAANATRQLSQAFASGELRGDELRSVMEQGQRIMIALQAQTGRTTRELREMAEAGQLTADVVANALLSELPKLRDELEQLPNTVSVAFSNLRAAFTQLAGALNEVTGATEGVAGVLNDVAEAMAAVADAIEDDAVPAMTTAEHHAEALESFLEMIQLRLDGMPESIQAGLHPLVTTLENVSTAAEEAAENVEDLGSTFATFDFGGMPALEPSDVDEKGQIIPDMLSDPNGDKPRKVIEIAGAMSQAERAAENLRIEMEKLKREMDDAFVLEQEQADAMAEKFKDMAIESAEAFERAREEAEKFRIDALEAAQMATDGIAGLFDRMARGVRVTFRDLAQEIMALMARIAFQNLIAQPLTNAFTGMFNSNSVGSALGTAGKAGATSAQTVINIDARYATESTAKMIQTAFQQNTPGIVRAATNMSVQAVAARSNAKRVG